MRLLAALALVAGSVLAAQAGADDIRGNWRGNWVLHLLDETPPSETVTITLAPETGGLSGRAPCNMYSGSFVGTLPAFQPGPIRSTRRACPALALEYRFFETLSAMTEAALKDGVLVLSDANGPRLQFIRDE